MFVNLLKPFGKYVNRWKWLQGRKMHGIWLGPPPKLLTEKDLLPGDVLFCGGGRGEKMRDLIRLATAGEYVHCALYIGNGEIVDVVLSGARRISLNTLLEKYSYVAATRCPGNEAYPERRKRLVTFGVAMSVKSGDRLKYNHFGAPLAAVKEIADIRKPDVRWRKEPQLSNSPKIAKRMFCSEFIINAYVDCEYMRRNDPFSQASRRTPNGLAEENIFEHLGYMSINGWDGVSKDDHFLGGCGWAISPEGRARLEQREREMDERIKRTGSAFSGSIARQAISGS
jgi:hypothetical protein